jgi:transposase
VQQLRLDYQRWLWPQSMQNLVFIDETGVNLAMTRLYARAALGQRAYASRPLGRGKNVTIIGAMALRGVLTNFTFSGSNNTDTFVTYLKDELLPKLWAGAIVIMDNLSVHRVEQVRQLIESVGAHLVYLPPYSPELNPIEMLWSKVKQFLRSWAARNYDDLDKAISNALAKVSLDDIMGWFLESDLCASLI